VRLGVAGPGGVRSPLAGAVFAAVLVALSLMNLPSSQTLPKPGRRLPRGAVGTGLPRGAVGTGLPRGALGAGLPWAAVGTGLPWGAVGAGLLCLAPLVVHLRTPGPALPTAQLPVWAAVVTAVAVAEELLLRGALWDALDTWPARPWLTLGITSVVFALMHWPFYGAAALPLDLAVGVLLGAMRLLTGGWAGPAFAHTVADLAGWWLR
jgi:membrane protease YdiL (CAAX protease family)